MLASFHLSFLSSINVIIPGNDLWMGAWGFASSASDVSLNWVDVASDTRDAQRFARLKKTIQVDRKVMKMA